MRQDLEDLRNYFYNKRTGNVKATIDEIILWLEMNDWSKRID